MSNRMNQIAFEVGQPAENGDGYLFTQEQFDEFCRAFRRERLETVVPAYQEWYASAPHEELSNATVSIMAFKQGTLHAFSLDPETDHDQ